MSITISIQIGDEDDRKSVQYFDIPVIPRPGEYFYVASSRDEDGNYNDTGRPEHKFDGIVDRVEYSYEERGISSGSNRETLYVNIYLVPGGPKIKA